MMKRLIILLGLLFPLAAAAMPWGGAGMMQGSSVPPPPVTPPSGGSVCNSPTVPSPANAAGFTTLAYCADFTTNTGTNNVFNTVAQTTNWASMAWLDCVNIWSSPGHGNQAGAQWVNYNAITSNNPCNTKTIVTDPSNGAQALLFQAAPSLGIGVVGITSAWDACSTTGNPCYITFPTTNSYVEINWRVDPTTFSNQGSGNGELFNLFNWYANSTGSAGCISINMFETFSAVSSGLVLGDVNNWCGSGGGATTTPQPSHNATHSPLDGNYHTTGNLATANSTTGYTCSYWDGVYNGAAGCNGVTAAQISGGTTLPQGYAVLWNSSAWSSHANTGNIPEYFAWIRIWVNGACWRTTTDPHTAGNTCSTASPFATAP